MKGLYSKAHTFTIASGVVVGASVILYMLRGKMRKHIKNKKDLRDSIEEEEILETAMAQKELIDKDLQKMKVQAKLISEEIFKTLVELHLKDDSLTQVKPL